MKYRPSAGFCLITVVAAAFVAFFAWGAEPPKLDRIWRMDIELKSGRGKALTGAERKLLQSALRTYPELASSLSEDEHAQLISANDSGRVDGKYAYLVRRSADEPGRIVVAYEGTSKSARVRVRARVDGSKHEGTASLEEHFSWDLPNDGPFPQLVELKLSDFKKGKKRKRRHTVRIDLVEAP